MTAHVLALALLARSRVVGLLAHRADLRAALDDLDDPFAGVNGEAIR